MGCQSSRTYFKVVVILLLLNFVSAQRGMLGGLGQRPRYVDAINLIPLLNDVANPILKSPCEIVTCLLNVTCQLACNSPLLTSAIGLLADLINTGVCKKGLIPCPDNLAIEKCLNPSTRQ